MLQSLPLLAVCFLAGLAGRRFLGFPKETGAVLNRIILYVALPALVLHALHTTVFSPMLLLAAVMLWLEFGAAYAVFFAFRKRLGLAAAGAMTLTAGLCNTAYLGLPMLSGMFGERALGPAIVIDQLGSFVMLATGAIVVASQASGAKVTAGLLVKRIATFPPFIAMAIALATRWIPFPLAMMNVLQRLGDLLTPLALISVGVTLELSGIGPRLGRIAGGLAFKLVAAPALVLGVFTLLGGRGFLREVTVLQSAMAPMVTGGILATEYGLEPELASALIGVGIPLSFLTIPAWAWLLERIASP